jgi:CheY-like chemotaxis protein
MTHSLPPKSLVLYADDDPEDIQLIRDAFADYSQKIELLTFSNGTELLNFIQDLQPFQPIPCLIIIDVNMPRLGGKETLRRLRRMEGYEEVPVVLFSTSTLPSEFAFAQSFNAGFVTKPLHEQQINTIVDQLIDQCTDEVKRIFKKDK